MHTETAMVRLAPRRCGSWDGAQVSDSSNALTNVDSETYASMAGSGNGFVSNFDYTQIPTNATITSFYFRIKGESTSDSTGTAIIYYCYNGEDYTNASSYYRFSTTPQILTLNLSNSYSWERFTQYENNSSPQIRIAPNNTTLKIYGAELDVVYEYEAPDDHGIFNLILPRG